jgi:hypothetical protein
MTGDELRIVATRQGGPTAIAADDVALYWTNIQSGEIVRYVYR